MRNKPILAALVAAISLVGGAALAHTSIAESDPADNSTIEALPEEVSIRFGNPAIPAPQPAQLTEATLLVLDPCGGRADNDDAAWDETTSTLTATTKQTSKAGRYEMHWSGQSTDGDAQAGVLDFVVTGGSKCTAVERPDAADDIDLGFDATNVVARPTGAGADVTIALAARPSCKAFAAGADQLLAIAMDVNWDEEVDYTGAFTCKTKKVRKGNRTVGVAVYRLAVTEAGDKAPSLRLRARKAADNALSASIPASLLGDAGTLDLYVSSSTDSEECGDDTTCADRAPDLGWVRAL